MLSVLFYIIILIVTLLFFVAMCVVWALTVLFDRDRSILHRLSRIWTDFYFGIIPAWHRQVSGLENIEQGKPYVVVVNHRSMIDIPLMYVLPFNFKWVSKREVYKWPIFGWVLWMHGDIAIERGSSRSLRKMIAEGKDYLSRGVSVIVFPEGTRAKSEQLGRFHEGAFLLAKEAGAAVLPCVTIGTDTASFGWRINFKNRFKVKILPPVDAEQVQGANPKELAMKMREIMNAEREKMKTEL